MAKRAKKSSSTLSYMHTLEYLIAKMSDPGDDFPVDFKPVLKVD